MDGPANEAPTRPAPSLLKQRRQSPGRNASIAFSYTTRSFTRPSRFGYTAAKSRARQPYLTSEHLFHLVNPGLACFVDLLGQTNCIYILTIGDLDVGKRDFSLVETDHGL